MLKTLNAFLNRFKSNQLVNLGNLLAISDNFSLNYWGGPDKEFQIYAEFNESTISADYFKRINKLIYKSKITCLLESDNNTRIFNIKFSTKDFTREELLYINTMLAENEKLISHTNIVYNDIDAIETYTSYIEPLYNVTGKMCTYVIK